MRPVTGEVRSAVREHRTLLLLVLALVLLGFAAEWVLGFNGMVRTLWYRPSFRYFLILIPIPVLFAFPFLRLRARGPDGGRLNGLPGWQAAWAAFRRDYLRVERVTGALLAGAAVPVVINLYGQWKLRIPRIQPFAWDETFASADRVLHFGRHPWEWLQPVLGHPLLTSSLDLIYYTWLPLVGLVCAWQAWSPRREARFRFFLVFVLVWIGLGNVVATLLSSAGPCYWDELGLGPNPYASLFAYHEAVREVHPLGTAFVQEALWSVYLGERPGSPYLGISAMPSVHVAMPVLYALASRATSPRLAAAFGAYGLLIFLGSVHLGWHYAVDGYVSVLLVVLLWKLSGRLITPGLERAGAGTAGVLA